MHIAFLLSEYPHPKIFTNCGGIGTATRNIVSELAKAHQISLFLYGQEKDETIIEKNITIYKRAKNTYRFFGWYLYRKDLVKFINRIVKKENIDIIEAPDWTGITAFMKFKIPHIIRLHGSDTYFCYLDKRKQKWKNYFFEKKAYKNATAIISVSEYTLKITQKIFQIKKPAMVIPNGIQLENFLTDETSKIKENSLLYFGSLIRKKGVLELATIFNELIEINPKAILTVAGRDVVDIIENKSTLQLMLSKLSNKAKKKFIYLGIVPYSEMNKVIESTSVCVFPSLAESFGMVTIEAMALKKGIVNTNYPWAKEIMIDGETGFTENPKNHKSFAIKIDDLLINTELRNKFGNSAFIHVKANFSIKKVIDENITFYNKVINNEV